MSILPPFHNPRSYLPKNIYFPACKPMSDHHWEAAHSHVAFCSSILNAVRRWQKQKQKRKKTSLGPTVVRLQNFFATGRPLLKRMCKTIADRQKLPLTDHCRTSSSLHAGFRYLCNVSSALLSSEVDFLQKMATCI